MNSPRSNTLKHLQKLGLVSKVHKITNFKGTSLDFTKQSEVPDSEDRPILVILANNHIYYGKIVIHKAEDNSAIFIFADGSYFQGSCKAGKFEGKGKLIKFAQDFKGKIFSYDGEWHNSKPHGYGKQEIQKSMVYEGQFVNGQKTGKGVMQYIDGSRYEGQFYNNQVHGQGVYKTKAHQWKGQWKQGYLQGEGQQISLGQFIGDQKDQQLSGGQSVYNGGFLRGLKHGKGIYKWGKNFSEYQGNFDKGQLDGEGRFRIGDLQYTGKWKKGVQMALQSKIQLKKVNKSSIIQSNLKIDIP